jgi:hypothetical protein
MTRFQSSIRVLVAAVAVGAVALVSFGAAARVDAAGLSNCIEISGPAADRAGCWEDVWASGDQVRMTFATGRSTQHPGGTPGDVDRFYLIAPQTNAPQSLDAGFRHDHVVRDVPARNGGGYSVLLRGYFVLCSAEGIGTGDCVFEVSPLAPGFDLPLAKTVNGQPLTSVGTVESASDAGLITLLDTGAVIVGTINDNK